MRAALAGRRHAPQEGIGPGEPDGSRYLNFPGFQEEGEEMMRKSFGGQYEHLIALKQQYDPSNLFRLNQNVKP